jgi:hypothetical protein
VIQIKGNAVNGYQARIVFKGEPKRDDWSMFDTRADAYAWASAQNAEAVALRRRSATGERHERTKKRAELVAIREAVKARATATVDTYTREQSDEAQHLNEYNIIARIAGKLGVPIRALVRVLKPKAAEYYHRVDADREAVRVVREALAKQLTR